MVKATEKRKKQNTLENCFLLLLYYIFFSERHTHDLIQFEKNGGETPRRGAGEASQVKCQATQKMCGVAWQIYLTAATTTKAAAAAKQCELKFIWGLTIRKQHRDDKLFGHQAQNLHANTRVDKGKGRKVEGWGSGRCVSDTCQRVVEKLIIFTKVNSTLSHTHTQMRRHVYAHE